MGKTYATKTPDSKIDALCMYQFILFLFLGLLINYCSVKYFINFRPKECFFKRVCISETFKFITDVVYINLVEKCYYTNLRVVGIL